MMQRIGTVGLCLLALLAASIALSASAWAAKDKGVYAVSDKSEVEIEVEGFEGGTEKVIEEIAESHIRVGEEEPFPREHFWPIPCDECGYYSMGNVLTHVTLGGISCHSAGAFAGEVKTEPMVQELGFISKAKGEVGLEERPQNGELLAKFTCGKSTVEYKGALIGRLTPINTKLTRGDKEGLLDEAAVVDGKQAITGFEGGPKAVLEVQINGGGFREVARREVADLTPAGSLEVSTASGRPLFVVTPGPTCAGANLTGSGSSLQSAAQQKLWSPPFDAICAEPFPTQQVEYLSTSSGEGLASWGVGHNAAKFKGFGASDAFVGTDQPPNAVQQSEILERGPGAKLLSIPVLQAAVALPMHLPEGCTAESVVKGKGPKRLVLSDATLQGIFAHTITKWNEAASFNGDKLKCASKAQEESPIVRVVRKEGSGTTAILEKFLAEINRGSVDGAATWRELAEEDENVRWPAESEDLTRAAKGSGIAATVAATPGSIGYANLGEVRANVAFTPAGGGGEGSAIFWPELQSDGTKFEDPASNGEQNAAANANCKSEVYLDGTGTKFPPASTEGTWNEATASTVQKSSYPLCGLSYDLSLTDYQAFSEEAHPTSTAEVETVKEYLTFALGEGQTLLEGHDFLGLPTSKKAASSVLGIARAGAEKIGAAGGSNTLKWWVEGHLLTGSEPIAEATNVIEPFKQVLFKKKLGSEGGFEVECGEVKVKKGSIVAPGAREEEAIVYSDCTVVGKPECAVQEAKTKALTATLEGTVGAEKLKFKPKTGSEIIKWHILQVTGKPACTVKGFYHADGEMTCNYKEVEEELGEHPLEFTATSGSNVTVEGVKAAFSGTDAVHLASGKLWSAF
jgi:ABC-type phosphate transport system substrate-binding protein